MQTYEVEVKFIDGTTVVIEVEAKNEDDALTKAMPISLRI
jgi:hypothetical protein